MSRASTLAPAKDFAELFAAAVASVAAQVPELHRKFMSEAGDFSFELQVGVEAFRLHHGQVSDAEPEDTSPLLRVEPTALVALVEGELALIDALADGGLDIVGQVAQVATIDRVLQLLVHGIVRSSDAPALMRQLHSLAVDSTTASTSLAITQKAIASQEASP